MTMDPIRKIPAFWLRRSLKFWLATGMIMSLAPVYIFAIASHFLYNNVIIQPLLEVTSKQKEVLQPLQGIQLTLWDASVSVVDHAIDGQPRHVNAYEQQSRQIANNFQALAIALQEQGYSQEDINLAEAEWHELDAQAQSILADTTISNNYNVGENVEAFEDLIDELAHQLARIHDEISRHNEETHQAALDSLALSEILVLIGLLISTIGAILGVIVINRSLVNSMNRLAAGSIRFTQGDRNHQIQVQIPRELANVAEAFNTMTNKIRTQEKRLEDLAKKDGLTGLYNRRSFDEMLAKEVQSSLQQQRSLGIIMGDVDHFKSFNDTYGHQAGDEVLRVISEVLVAHVRDMDKVFRFGGEEFVIVMPSADIPASLEIAERVRSAVEMTDIQLDEQTIGHVTISLGVAVLWEENDSAPALIKRADKALYDAKESGRNQIKTST